MLIGMHHQIGEITLEIMNNHKLFQNVLNATEIIILHFARHCRSKILVKAPNEKSVGADIDHFNLKKDRRNNKLLWLR